MTDAFVDFFLRNKFVILFYLAVVLFVFLNRKKFNFYFKIIALYRTNWGIKLMDKLAEKYREPIKLFGYISIGVGFIGMFFIVFVLIQSIYTLFTTPNAPPALTPILPGVHVPGVPESLFIPLVKGIIAIFIVAVIHEFSHGVVARAHNLTIKRTGIAIIGPFFAAFVEPDEKELKKRDDITNYSMVAAGPVSNIVTFFILFLLISFAVSPVINSIYSPSGISFSSITDDSPAANAGLQTDVTYTMINNQSVTSLADFLRAFENIKPNDVMSISNSENTYFVETGTNPDDNTRAYLGVNIYNRLAGDTTTSFKIVSWFTSLLSLIGILSLGIGIANLLPIGPLDGGKMLQQALHKIRGEKKGNKTLVHLSLFFLLVILLLLTPIFRETAKSIFGIS
ncbi:hypothetical protein CMO88_01325 [Candidatus Woesearchaeota archaeon]|nr:hypothetical protein [Candidatus Woesearchaeota archaeon]|tara:strand:+ start:15467 stop:16654 length:1188 start_codon:yes stop_codon:yes gene_type:complete